MTGEPRGLDDRPTIDAVGQLGVFLPHPAVPGRLYRRVVESLVARGLIRSAYPPWIARTPRLVAALAVGLMCFAAGINTGQRQVPLTAPRAGVPEFALLLYGSPVTRSDDALRAHQQWAARLAREGQQLLGKRLADAATVLQQRSASKSATPADFVLTGFFVIRAASTEEALRIARSLPHYQTGGQVVVRPIDPT